MYTLTRCYHSSTGSTRQARRKKGKRKRRTNKAKGKRERKVAISKEAKGDYRESRKKKGSFGKEREGAS